MSSEKKNQLPVEIENLTALSAAEVWAKEVARHNGVTLPSTPEKKLGDFPSDVSSLTSVQLSEHLAYWASMVGYASTRTAILDGLYAEATADYEMEFDLRYYYRTDEHVTDRRHKAGAMDTVRWKRQKMVDFDRKRLLMRSILRSYEMCYYAISRELSRRKIEADAGTSQE